MPLDRRITIKIRAEGTRNDMGEYVPGTSTDYDVWASVSDGGSYDTIFEDGTQVTQIKQFLVRWFPELFEASVSNLSLEFDGREYAVKGITESQSRRRFFSIQGEFTS